MKYHVGQMLKFIGASDPPMFNGMVGVVEEPDIETVTRRMMFNMPIYNMNFPGYYCAACDKHHNVDVVEDALKPIDDPDKDDEVETDEELDEELVR